MLNKENIIFVLGVILLIVVLIIFQLFVFSKGFYSISADEAGHTLEGFWWFKGQNNIYSVWLPFQKILYGISFHIHYNLFSVPRILSSIFGILTLLSLIFLTKELFQNKIVSVLSGFLASIFYGVVIFSVIPLSEIYFFFFVIASLALLFHWIRTKREFSLWAGIIFSSVGTTTRYEAWIFSFLIFAVITIKIYSINKTLKNHIFRIIGMMILLFSFPLYWIYLSFVVTIQPTGFIEVVVERYNPGGLLTEIRNNVLYQFITINTSCLNILGLITIIFYYKKDSSIKTYAFLFLSTLLVVGIVTFFSKAMPSHNSWRLATIWSILFIPFTAQWLYILLSDERKYFKFNSIVFFIILTLFFYNQTLHYIKESYMNKEDIIIGEYLNNKLSYMNPSSKIFIERDKWRYSSLLITSQIPDRFITDKELFNNSILTSSKDLLIELKRYNIEYLIFRTNGQLIKYFKSLQKVKKFENWTIYKFH